MTGRPRCYVASPLGFTEGGRSYYRTHFLPALEAVADTFDPWSVADDLDLSQLAPREVVDLIGSRNATAITSCSVLIAYLDGQEVDSGTAAEIGYAAAKGLTCFGLRTDMRCTGDLRATVNVQLEWFIRSTGGTIVNSLTDLVDAVRSVNS